MATHAKSCKETGTRMFSCGICQKAFASGDTLRRHRQRVHEENPVACSVCQKACKNPIALKSHMKSHERRICTICGRTVNHLAKHMWQHSQLTATCLECNKDFATKAQLKIHTHVVHEHNESRCSLCQKTFKNRTLLKQHQQNHEKSMCSVCGESVSNLTQHLLIHGEKRYACDLCPKRFAQPAGLYQHKQVFHGTGKPNRQVPEEKRTCKCCGKVLSSNMALYTHKKQVHGIGNCHLCPVCGKSCATKRSLDEHKNVHSTERTENCTECSSTFKSQRALIEHLKRKHGIATKYRPLQ